MTAHTTSFIVNGNDYFVAHLDDGGIRIGMVGGVNFSVPADHADYEGVCAVTNEFDAEILFDLMYAEHLA